MTRPPAILMLLLLAALTGCDRGSEKSAEPPSICDQTQATFLRCVDGTNAAHFEEIHTYCTKGSRLAGTRAMFDTCAAAESCDEFGGCFERHGCRVVIFSERDKTLELMCDLDAPTTAPKLEPPQDE